MPSHASDDTFGCSAHARAELLQRYKEQNHHDDNAAAAPAESAALVKRESVKRRAKLQETVSENQFAQSLQALGERTNQQQRQLASRSTTNHVGLSNTSTAS